MAVLDAKELNRKLSEKIESVCHWLLPNGKKIGNEWCVGDAEGAVGKSCRVNLGDKAGVWQDFSTGEGGDLIKLIEITHNTDFRGAIDEASRFLGIDAQFSRSVIPVTKKKVYSRPKDDNRETPPSADLYAWFKNVRGISKRTVDAYGIREIRKEGNIIIVFPYFNECGGTDLFHRKYRDMNNKHNMWSTKDTRRGLFGWQVVDPKCDQLIITEGEIDAMSYYEQGFQAVSVPNGGGGGGKQQWIDEEWERMNGYRQIFLSLDMDDTGKEGAREIEGRLGSYRCFYVNLGQYKDANDALRAGISLKEKLEDAETRDPEELKEANMFWDEAVTYKNDAERCTGEKLPWAGLDGKVGLRLGELIIWSGYNGHGKSQVLGHLITKSIADGNSWCVASMEFKPAKFLNRLNRQICGDYSWEKHELGIKTFLDEKLYFIDIQGRIDIKKICEVFNYAYRRYGIKHFLVDSLAKCGINEDDYNTQKNVSDTFSDFARDNDVQVHLVVHTRKGKTEYDVPDKFDIKGTGGIVDMADSAFIVWRNKPKEEGLQENPFDPKWIDKPDCYVCCVKQREGDWEGRKELFFDRKSLQYDEKKDFVPVSYCLTEEEVEESNNASSEE